MYIHLVLKLPVSSLSYKLCPMMLLCEIHKICMLLAGNNEGGDLEHGKAIFSNPTDVVIEGHGNYVHMVMY